MSTGDADISPWEAGSGGRGLLIRLDTSAPELLLWEVDADGRPFHAAVLDALDLEFDRVLASLIVEPDGTTTVADAAGAFNGRSPAEWVWALDERLSPPHEWIASSWDFSG